MRIRTNRHHRGWEIKAMNAKAIAWDVIHSMRLAQQAGHARKITDYTRNPVTIQLVQELLNR